MSGESNIVAIIGAGAAGMSCALWLKQFHLTPILIESAPIPGGLTQASPFANNWLLGHTGKTGEELAEEFTRHVLLENISIMRGAWVESASKNPEGFTLSLALQETAEKISIEARAIVLATGTRIRGLEQFAEVPGVDAMKQAGLIDDTPATQEKFPLYAGKRIAIIGGGDNAYEGTLWLAPVAEKIHLIMRGAARATGHARAEVAALAAQGRVQMHQGQSAESFTLAHGEVTLGLTGKNGEMSSLTVDHVLLRTGFAPNSEAARSLLAPLGELQCDENGYILTDPDMRTSIPGVYAAGDIANPHHPCIATAIAQGTMAARTIEKDLFPNE